MFGQILVEVLERSFAFGCRRAHVPAPEATLGAFVDGQAFFDCRSGVNSPDEAHAIRRLVVVPQTLSKRLALAPAIRDIVLTLVYFEIFRAVEDSKRPFMLKSEPSGGRRQ